MKIIITESAADDIAEGYLFYEKQSRGLGDYFESSIFTDIRSLVIYSGVHEVHFGIYYRKITKHFPYAIYYTIDGDAIRVHAVIDTRRDPARTESRFAQN
ncbi:MAG: type II toxin-antitoxin system RelE/ParE family toxin [Acidobacteria bacterium]|nr:type II toxin-antitoxin system RelE/ParE family toxin [Acidobacteriota bacterium]